MSFMPKGLLWITARVLWMELLGLNQRAVYNRHKRVHSMKFQSVVATNDIEIIPGDKKTKWLIHKVEFKLLVYLRKSSNDKMKSRLSHEQISFIKIKIC